MVVIGDRPAANLLPHILKVVKLWQEAGVNISKLNRHEASWSHLPELLSAGVDVTLGSDWAYFWGNAASRSDIFWSRIAALCARDPTLSTIGISPEEHTIMLGLLNAVSVAVDRPAKDTGDWQTLAEPIIERIAANDRDFFTRQAPDFQERLAITCRQGRVEGRLIFFNCPPGPAPQIYPWALEKAIEQQGRALSRAVHYNTPYAVAMWPEEGGVECIAMNHWREESAIPIRLLYPTDIGSRPHGSESIISARLSPDQAEVVLQRLILSCNQTV